MGSEYYLDVGVEAYQEFKQSLLPFDVEADFRFVHEEHEGLPVLHQYGEQDDEHLLFAAGELVG